MHEEDGSKIVAQGRGVRVETDHFGNVGGIEPDGFGKFGNGQIGFGFHEQGGAQEVTRLWIRGIEGFGFLELKFGFFQAAEANQSAAEIDARLDMIWKT